MTGIWAIDTGIAHNACALARVERSRGGVWDARVWSWQGSTGSPIRIEHVVGPETRRLLKADDARTLIADGFYVHELRRGVGDEIVVKVKGGDLVDEYAPTRRLVEHHEPRLYVHPIGHVWTPRGWEEDPRMGERVRDGIAAVQRRMVGGQLVLSMPDHGRSHYDEAVAVMRALRNWERHEVAQVTASVFGVATYTHRADWYPTPE